MRSPAEASPSRVTECESHDGKRTSSPSAGHTSRRAPPRPHRRLVAAGLEFQLMKDALHEEEGDGPMLLDRAMKDAGVASPGTRLRILGFLMHTSLSAEDLEHRERQWIAENTEAKVIAE